ncbi:MULTISPECIES: dihydrodipicolinate synthase family protein [Actinomycetes]|uniref:Dihydrodipicolinate synthase family protein n=2 Tax=Actinomycetes TaxID=1760 RepID=A0ABP6LWT0_9MICC
MPAPTAAEIFSGLSAFPLTPFRRAADGTDTVDLDAVSSLVARCASAGAQSITVLGSTGSYAYLDRTERRDVLEAAVAASPGSPVLAGVGALRTSAVLEHVRDAEAAGADGLLLAPVSYQPLSEDEVVGLFDDVCRRTELPVALYDNPRTTGFRFTPELYGRIAALPQLAAVKIPPLPEDPAQARDVVAAVRTEVPDDVALGISGDPSALRGLTSGCAAWFSVIGGVLPGAARRLVERRDDTELTPLWPLMATHGSLRVAAAAAEHLGLAPRDCLPRPLRGLDEDARAHVADALETVQP